MTTRTLVHLVHGGHTLDIAVSRWYTRVFIRLDGEERASFVPLPGTITHTLRVPKTGFHEGEGKEDVYEVAVTLDSTTLRKRCLVTVQKNGQVFHGMPIKAASHNKDGGYSGDVQNNLHRQLLLPTVLLAAFLVTSCWLALSLLFSLSSLQALTIAVVITLLFFTKKDEKK